MTELQQGNSFTFELNVVDAAGAPVDVTAAPITFILWRIGDAVANLELTEADPGVTGDVDGLVKVVLTTTNTELPLGKYDLELRVVVGTLAQSRMGTVEVVDTLTYQGPQQ